jgi:hypothetical protein
VALGCLARAEVSGSGPDAVGVFGQGGAASPGVVGQAGSGPADGVRDFGRFSGVAGFGDPNAPGTGVFGLGRGRAPQGSEASAPEAPNTSPDNAVGVYGQAGAADANGVEGHGAVCLARGWPASAIRASLAMPVEVALGS